MTPTRTTTPRPKVTAQGGQEGEGPFPLGARGGPPQRGAWPYWAGFSAECGAEPTQSLTRTDRHLAAIPLCRVAGLVAWPSTGFPRCRTRLMAVSVSLGCCGDRVPSEKRAAGENCPGSLPPTRSVRIHNAPEAGTLAVRKAQLCPRRRPAPWAGSMSLPVYFRQVFPCSSIPFPQFRRTHCPHPPPPSLPASQ